MRSQPHKLTLLVELEKFMPLGCKPNRLSSWMQFNIRFAISLNFAHLQKEANKEKVWAVAGHLQETATCIFLLLNAACLYAYLTGSS
jgi:hypothetical protein